MDLNRFRPKKTPKEIAVLVGQKIYATIKGTVSNRRLMAQVLAAATATAGVTAGGVVTAHHYNDRIGAVEDSSRSAQSAVVDARAQIEELSARAKELEAQVDASASDTAAANDALKANVQELTSISGKVSDIAAALSDTKSSMLDTKAALEENQAALSDLSNRLASITEKLRALSDRADAADAESTKTKEELKAELADAQARLPMTFDSDQQFSEGVVASGEFTSIGGKYRVEISAKMFTFTDGSCNRLIATLDDGTLLAQSFLMSYHVNDQITGSGSAVVSEGKHTFTVELFQITGDCSIVSPSITITKAG